MNPIFGGVSQASGGRRTRGRRCHEAVAGHGLGVRGHLALDCGGDVVVAGGVAPVQRADPCSGRIRVPVGRTYDLADVPAAFADFATGTIGKISIAVQPS